MAGGEKEAELKFDFRILNRSTGRLELKTDAMVGGAVKPMSQHASQDPARKALALRRRSGRVLRDHLPDDSPLMHDLGGRRVISLGPLVVDGGAPAQALARAVGIKESPVRPGVVRGRIYGCCTGVRAEGSSCARCVCALQGGGTSVSSVDFRP